jgi:hypothetical protein
MIARFAYCRSFCPHVRRVISTLVSLRQNAFYPLLTTGPKILSRWHGAAQCKISMQRVSDSSSVDALCGVLAPTFPLGCRYRTVASYELTNRILSNLIGAAFLTADFL